MHHHDVHEDGQVSVEYALTIALAIGLTTAVAVITTPAGDLVARVVDTIMSAL
jgi:hypothetical protein